MNDILHILNLDTIGGVEELFIHFLTQSPSYYRHHLLITGAPIHPHFYDRVKHSAASITYEKYLFGTGIKIPKLLRQLKRFYLFYTKKFSRILLWNRFEKIHRSIKASIIYYEHGASWIESQGSLSADYFDPIDTILVNSQAAKQILELKWGIHKPMFVIENPLRPDLCFSKTARSLPQGTFTIGYIGRLIPLKGTLLLLHALKKLEGTNLTITLKIAGVGPERDTLEKEALRLGIASIVQFLGTITVVDQFYDSIDLLVVPSIREPLGLVALEAAARGCPVIATLVDGLPEVVIDGETGFCIEPTLPVEQYIPKETLSKLPDLVFNPKDKKLQTPLLLDPNSIADHITKLMQQPDEYMRLSGNAIAFAKKRSDFSTYTDQLIRFLSFNCV